MSQDANKQKFDYIIVGSGAGGAPLAARLVQAGKRVLVIEAGPNHADQPDQSPANEVSQVPALHLASTEHEELSWQYFVEHYQRNKADPTTSGDGKADAAQPINELNHKDSNRDPSGELPDGIAEDPKRHHSQDPARSGIFYPRATGVGGCTIHNAMITITSSDTDWDNLADLLGDDSWRGAHMRSYFQRLENCEYHSEPLPSSTNTLSMIRSYVGDSLAWLFGFTPDRARGGHGFSGWLHTSIQDISLGLNDPQIVRMVWAALKQCKREGIEKPLTLVRQLLGGKIKNALDPNHRHTQSFSPEGIVMVPVAIHGRGRDQTGQQTDPQRAAPVQLGKRSSPRELLAETKAQYGELLTIWSDCIVTRILLTPDDDPPRAYGVEVRRGARLYRANMHPSEEPGVEDFEFVHESGEVILCAGAFNTPQLLMLSGIGDYSELRRHGINCRVHLPGVGKNLQDRYEVSLVGKMASDFKVLSNERGEKPPFQLPDNPNKPDEFLKAWRNHRSGLYSTNGAVLGIFKRSRPDLRQPDLFIFGAPLEFRGYQVGYSQVSHYDRFSWVILKSHSNNRDGVVRLRSDSPLDTPIINFHYFNSLSRPGQSAEDPDVAALAEGVRFVRDIFQQAGSSVVQEIYPAQSASDPQSINTWIRSVAWGHHACGTCRMGRADDPDAVLDSQFRVLGVAGLRVVDASIFSKIPGYFIVSNIYIASEKAADVILQGAHQVASRSQRYYPHDLFQLEQAAIAQRRKLAEAADEQAAVQISSTHEQHQAATKGAPGNINARRTSSELASGTSTGSLNLVTRWDDATTGLALSGGGIRSATMNLGVLQSFARSSWLRRIDFLSTVSGGGYIGGCLGRSYDRIRQSWPAGGKPGGKAPVETVEQELSQPGSRLVDWLRKHGNYLAPLGYGDARLNTAIYLRNLISVHFVIGLAIFAIFGSANIVRYVVLEKTLAIGGLALSRDDLPIGSLISSSLGPFFSPWFILVELLLLFFVLPRITAYWITSQREPEAFNTVPLFVLVAISSLFLYLGVSGELRLEPLVMGVALLTSFIHVELVWRWAAQRQAAVGSDGDEIQPQRTRNYLTTDLGLGLVLTGGVLVFTTIDTIAHGLQQWAIAGTVSYAQAFSAIGAMLVAGVPFLRWVAEFFSRQPAKQSSSLSRILQRDLLAGVLAVVLFVLPLILYSFASHAVFDGGHNNWAGIAATLFALIVTVIFGLPGAMMFVNRSSLAGTYASRLCRAYLGASNPLRQRPEGMSVMDVIPGDDVLSISDYQPHLAGGPLHIINATANQTMDRHSRQRKRDRKGEAIAVSCLGLSVGDRWHSRWSCHRSTNGQPTTQLIPIGLVPGEEHPLVDELGRPSPEVERMSLSNWMGISGAAVSPGRGAGTNLGTSLLMGLANLRTGHWWDSGIPASDRTGFPNLTFMRRLLYLVPRFFATQSLIIYEWLATYPGPWERFWHLADGGFFENTGGYELVRRRIPRIILCDGSADPTYELECLAEFIRKVAIDFGAVVEPFTSQEIDQYVPESVRGMIGLPHELRPVAMPQSSSTDHPVSKKHASLFWITYNDEPQRTSVLLYLKATVTGDEPVDIQHYRSINADFPHESTADQLFDEAQWESYRKLGEHISSGLTLDREWFWQIPVG